MDFQGAIKAAVEFILNWIKDLGIFDFAGSEFLTDLFDKAKDAAKSAAE